MEGSRGYRISDADRERAAQRLHTAMAEGRITFAELDERLAAVYAARYQDELGTPLADIPAHPDAAALASAPRGQPVVLRSALGDIKRRGGWRVGQVIEVHSSMGSVLLDFTTAEITDPVVDVRLKVGAGTVRLILPDGATADVDGVATSLGNVKCKVPGGPQPGRLHLRVAGKLNMGDLIVRYAYEVGRYRF